MNIETVQVIFSYIAGIFTFFAAFFSLWEALRNEKHEPIKAWFKHIWNIINESNWIKLPEITIKWFLKSIEKLKKVLFNLFTGVPYFWIKDASFEFGGSNFVINIVSFLFANAIYFALQGTTSFYFHSLRILFFSILFVAVLSKWLITDDVAILSGIFYLILFPFFLIISIIIWFLIFLISNLFVSFFIYIVICITIWGFLNLFFEKRWPTNTGFITAIVFASLFITLFSFLIGHLICPDLWIPKTFLMLISNITFDIFTIYITICLLTWAVSNQNIYKIPVAVLIDIILAALFACFSLYFGLIFSDKSLSIREIFNVLIAKSTDGNNIELGPYFWVMHTTFLPTLFYCIIIFITWLAKVILIPIVWFFGKGQENKNPLKLTAALFAIIASFFAVFALFLGIFK